jgi:hypothetical protein
MQAELGSNRSTKGRPRARASRGGACAGVAWATRVAAVTLCLLVHGCDDVQGGAVELSWKLRPASSKLPDKFVDCDANLDITPGAGSVEKIRLSWRVSDGQATIDESSHDFRCQDNHGITRFELAPGFAELWVTPVCGGTDATAELAAANTYISPAPVQRHVTRGDTVSLGAVELVVAVSDCDAGQPCICAPP